jgi:hypothetical protein
MRLTRYASSIFIFLIFASSFTFVIATSIGVQPGHWAKYTATDAYTGYEIYSLTISISSVSGTKVNGTMTYEYPNRSPQTQPLQGDVSRGDTFPYIIPANLNKGDTIKDNIGFSSTIESIETRSYAGASRTVVYATVWFSSYYWDQQTGTLVEQNSLASSLKLTETNIWGGGIFGASNPFFWVLVVVIVVVVAAVALVMLSSLRKKKPLTETVTPPSPPEKSAKTKYCLKCGTSMPLDSVYCPKCGHKQHQT